MVDYIDPLSEYSLYDVVDDKIPLGESTEYMGFHIISAGASSYTVQYDGHIGSVATIDPDEYDDVLELVDRLNSLVVRLHECEHSSDEMALYEWAGRVMTDRKEKAEENPEKYYFVNVPIEDAG